MQKLPCLSWCQNGDEIDTPSLESISPIFYKQLFRQYSFAKKIPTQTVSREKLLKSILYEKDARKMLVKLTPVGPPGTEVV